MRTTVVDVLHVAVPLASYTSRSDKELIGYQRKIDGATNVLAIVAADSRFYEPVILSVGLLGK